MVIREIAYREYAFLEEMLYQALFVPKGEKPFPRDIIKSLRLHAISTASAERETPALSRSGRASYAGPPGRGFIVRKRWGRSLSMNLHRSFPSRFTSNTGKKVLVPDCCARCCNS